MVMAALLGDVPGLSSGGWPPGFLADHPRLMSGWPEYEDMKQRVLILGVWGWVCAAESQGHLG